MSDTLEIADRLFRAVEAGDIELIRNELYAPGFTIWHNYDGRYQTTDENLKMLGWLTRHVRNVRYEEVRRQEITGGFLEQHVLRGELADGTKIEAPTCMIGYIADGKITRLEEYLDTAQVAPMLYPTRAAPTA